MLLDASVAEIIPPKPLFTASPTTPVSRILDVFRKDNLGSVVITENGRPIGIFTERDFIRKVIPLKLDLSTVEVSEFMTENPVSVQMNDGIAIVVIQMQMGNFRHVVVVDHLGKATNIVSVKDVMDYLVEAVKGINFSKRAG